MSACDASAVLVIQEAESKRPSEDQLTSVYWMFANPMGAECAPETRNAFSIRIDRGQTLARQKFKESLHQKVLFPGAESIDAQFFDSSFTTPKPDVFKNDPWVATWTGYSFRERAAPSDSLKTWITTNRSLYDSESPQSSYSHMFPSENWAPPLYRDGNSDNALARTHPIYKKINLFSPSQIATLEPITKMMTSFSFALERYQALEKALLLRAFDLWADSSQTKPVPSQGHFMLDAAKSFLKDVGEKHGFQNEFGRLDRDQKINSFTEQRQLFFDIDLNGEQHHFLIHALPWLALMAWQEASANQVSPLPAAPHALADLYLGFGHAPALKDPSSPEGVKNWGGVWEMYFDDSHYDNAGDNPLLSLTVPEDLYCFLRYWLPGLTLAPDTVKNNSDL